MVGAARRTIAAPTEAPDAAPSAEPILTVAGLRKSWPSRSLCVLEGVDLVVEPGAALLVSGVNGAGKTTLLRAIAGLISPDDGEIRVCGLDRGRDGTRYMRALGFGSAGNTGLYARLKVEHHLDLAARLALMPRADREPAIDDAMCTFELGPLTGTRVDRLSMGQRQRLRLALAFVHRPKLVLLDEPTTSMDEEGVALLSNAIAALKSRGGAALVCAPTGAPVCDGIDLVFELVAGRLRPA